MPAPLDELKQKTVRRLEVARLKLQLAKAFATHVEERVAAAELNVVQLILYDIEAGLTEAAIVKTN